MGQLPFERKESKLLIREKAETSEKFGCDPYERPMHDMIEYGMFNLDKPSGPTSHEVTSYVKKILGIDKAGHSGTLDPKVTGVLPVGLGKGARLAHPLLQAGKEYVTLMHIHDEIEESKILNVLEEFKGRISQMVPVRSAVKRRERERDIYYIDVLEIKDRDVLFKVGTQAGTYIRKLCHDIGEEIGPGAHMAELRRTKVGPFNEETLGTLQDLKDAFHVWKEENNEIPLKRLIQPVERAVDHLPQVFVFDTSVDTLCHGASLKVPGISKLTSGIKEDDTVAVMTLKGELIMIGTAQLNSKEMKNQERGVAVKPNQVYMKPDTYPKYES